MNTTKFNTLKDFLRSEGREVENIEQGVSNDIFDVETDTENMEWIVLTDKEANEHAFDYIRETLWAFNTDFILRHTDIERTKRIENAVSTMKEELCEDANEIIFAMIGEDNFDEFVENAIDEDGRGHFVSSYDGDEHEHFNEDEGRYYYLYRLN